MIVWRGYGILVAIFAGMSIVGTQVAAETMWGVPLTGGRETFSQVIGLFIAAGVTYGVHIALQRSDPPRTLVDKDTGQEVVVATKHDLFYIPVRWWAFIFAGVGVAMALAGLL